MKARARRRYLARRPWRNPVPYSSARVALQALAEASEKVRAAMEQCIRAFIRKTVQQFAAALMDSKGQTISGFAGDLGGGGNLFTTRRPLATWALGMPAGALTLHPVYGVTHIDPRRDESPTTTESTTP